MPVSGNPPSWCIWQLRGGRNIFRAPVLRRARARSAKVVDERLKIVLRVDVQIDVQKLCGWHSHPRIIP